MMAAPFEEQPIVVGDTILFSLEARKDRVTWDLTGGTVQLLFRKPGETTDLDPLDATITDGPAGKASYQCEDDLLDVDGDWTLRWFVTKGDVALKSRRIEFSVLP